VRPAGIVIAAPGFDDPARHWQAMEHVLVEALGSTSVRHLLPITVEIITVITTMRSASLSWSQIPVALMEKLDLYAMRACLDPS
jgi:hypothetical protein